MRHHRFTDMHARRIMPGRHVFVSLVRTSCPQVVLTATGVSQVCSRQQSQQ